MGRPVCGLRRRFSEERIHVENNGVPENQDFGAGHRESSLTSQSEKEKTDAATFGIAGDMAGWMFYHFHDTSAMARVRRPHTVRDNERLRADGGNLAAFLLALRGKDQGRYELIRDTIRLAAPFFDDFKLRPNQLDNGDAMIQLEWLQTLMDYPFHPSQLSDGTLRFICLAAALLQPDPPPAMFFDEPELGLHPEALGVLSGLFQQAATRTQIFAATQGNGWKNTHWENCGRRICLKEGREFEALLFSQPDVLAETPF